MVIHRKYQVVRIDRLIQIPIVKMITRPPKTDSLGIFFLISTIKTFMYKPEELIPVGKVKALVWDFFGL